MAFASSGRHYFCNLFFFPTFPNVLKEKCLKTLLVHGQYQQQKCLKTGHLWIFIYNLEKSLWCTCQETIHMLSHIIPASNECLQRKVLQNEYGMKVISNVHYSQQFKTCYTYWVSLVPFFRRLSLRKSRKEVNRFI